MIRVVRSKRVSDALRRTEVYLLCYGRAVEICLVATIQPLARTHLHIDAHFISLSMTEQCPADLPLENLKQTTSLAPA